MSSRIEQLIDEIEEYIDGCKYQTFSDTKIIVNKEEIDELLRELRMKTPDEIKRYQKIISNKEAILNDARAKAEALINEATLHTNQLINEHEIMQQAYAQANEVVHWQRSRHRKFWITQPWKQTVSDLPPCSIPMISWQMWKHLSTRR